MTWEFTPSRGKPDFRAGGSGTRTPGIHNALAQLADGRIMALGRFDLPAERTATNAAPGGLSVRSFVLKGHKLGSDSKE